MQWGIEKAKCVRLLTGFITCVKLLKPILDKQF